MFGLGAFNRLLRKQQLAEPKVLYAQDALTAKQMTAGTKALRLLKLSHSLEALTRDDMMNFLYAVGMNPTPDVLDGKLRLLRLHKHDTFTWGELAHVWSMLLRDAANEEQILERAFQFFDKDGNGEISVSELRTTMSELGDLLTEEEICAFIAIMDVNNDGVIGYQEFLETLRTEVPEFAKARASKEEQQAAEAALAADAGQTLNAAQDSLGVQQAGSMLQPNHLAANFTAGRGGVQRSAAALGQDEEQHHARPAAAAAIPTAAEQHSNGSDRQPAGAAAQLPPSPRLMHAKQTQMQRSLQQQHLPQHLPQQQQHQLYRQQQHLRAGLDSDWDNVMGSEAGAAPPQELPACDSLPGQAEEDESGGSPLSTSQPSSSRERQHHHNSSSSSSSRGPPRAVSTLEQ